MALRFTYKWLCCITAIVAATALPTFADDDEKPLRIKRNAKAQKNELTVFVLNMINDDRAKASSDAVKESRALSKLAQAYAEYLMKTDHFAHVDKEGLNPQDRADRAGIKAYVAENLAYQFDSEKTPRQLLTKAEAEMMDEPLGQPNHRHNITNPEHKYVGIGIAQKGDKVIMVQEFTGDL